MPTTVEVIQATEPKGPLGPGTIERRDLRDGDVSIDILFSGFCMSDCHSRDCDWGPTPFPLVPGHEIVGKVKETKDARFKVGDLVGVGCMVGSNCETDQTRCQFCADGDQIHCTKGPVLTYASKDQFDGSLTFGGYSKNIVVEGEFVLKVPDNLDPAGAAPLLCAGITTYSPLARFGAGPGKKVLVAGLGGLGHMAIKLAHAMGADVSLSSRSMAKAEEAKSLGANNILITSDEEQFKAAAGQYDIVIDTISVDHDFGPYLALLKPYGVLVDVGHIGPNKFNTAPLVFGNKIFAGSAIGGIKETQEMLDFCGKHDVVATYELVSFKDVNHVWDRLYKSDVKYRFVFDTATM